MVVRDRRIDGVNGEDSNDQPNVGVGSGIGTVLSVLLFAGLIICYYYWCCSCKQYM